MRGTKRFHRSSIAMRTVTATLVFNQTERRSQAWLRLPASDENVSKCFSRSLG